VPFGSGPIEYTNRTLWKVWSPKSALCIQSVCQFPDSQTNKDSVVVWQNKCGVPLWSGMRKGFFCVQSRLGFSWIYFAFLTTWAALPGRSIGTLFYFLTHVMNPNRDVETEGIKRILGYEWWEVIKKKMGRISRSGTMGRGRYTTLGPIKFWARSVQYVWNWNVIRRNLESREENSEADESLFPSGTYRWALCSCTTMGSGLKSIPGLTLVSLPKDFDRD